MSRKEYERRVNELSVQFLQEKRDGLIPLGESWAKWCWNKGIYPLTDEGGETPP